MFENNEIEYIEIKKTDYSFVIIYQTSSMERAISYFVDSFKIIKNSNLIEFIDPLKHSIKIISSSNVEINVLKKNERDDEIVTNKIYK